MATSRTQQRHANSRGYGLIMIAGGLCFLAFAFVMMSVPGEFGVVETPSERWVESSIIAGSFSLVIGFAAVVLS